MYIGRDLKVSIALIFAGLALLALVPGHALGAAGETRYELVADGVTFGNDGVVTGLKEAVFHQQALATADLEKARISFPGGLDFSPSQGVGLALPSISQTSVQAGAASCTGFFQANIPFYPCCNFGAAPVGVGQFGKPSPVTAARFEGSALMYPEMINKGILTPNLTYENKNVNNSMTTLPPAMASQPYGEVAAVSSATRGETMVNGASGNITAPRLLSNQRFNFDSNASQIDNYSIVERLWRNSHLSHLMDVAYEGESTYPSWMEPLKPTEALQRTNHSRVISYSLNMTQPGKSLTKGFWDINPLTPGQLPASDLVPAMQATWNNKVNRPAHGASSGNPMSSNQSLDSYFSSPPR